MPKFMMPGLKPYNIANINDDEAEITMYGEVVETQPTDWWTGEPIDGLYIILSEFLNDIDTLKSKNKVTVRINSVGGDLEAGVAIYNRLKAMKNVTTIVDGLAASAASLIAQAGSTRQVYNSSQMMAHQASTFVYGSYNSTELGGIKDMLDAANNQVISIYAETTGQSETKLRHMVEKTTWMTGQEIIDNGFADEIVDGNISMKMSADKRLFLCNGIPMNYKRLASMPANIVVDPELKAQTAEADANINNSNEEEKAMTLEELKEQCPELVDQIMDSAKAEASATMADAQNSAVLAERKRIEEIEAIQDSIADKDLVNKAKYGEEPMNARDLAFEAMKNQAALGNQFLKNCEADAAESNTDQVNASTADDEASAEEVKKAEEAEIIKNAVAAANAIKGGRK